MSRIHYQCSPFILAVQVVCICILSSCNIINKEERIPSYINVDTMKLSTNYPTEGSNSHGFSDAWLLVNGQSSGVYESAFTVPVLYDGIYEIKVRAGIKNNGIATTRITYPFVEPFVVTQKLVPESVLTITPTFQYKSQTTFVWLEDFESAAFSITDTVSTDTVMKVNTIDPFEGNKCGFVGLDASHPAYLGISSQSFTLPGSSQPVYLEFNYKSNQLFSVGLYSSSSTNPLPLLFITPSDQWNKIYVELTPYTSNPGNINPFRVYFAMGYNGSVSNPSLYIDNIKLLH